ncbi:MAG: hypothetical protein WC865_11505 [Bacteroidales bacterium]
MKEKLILTEEELMKLKSRLPQGYRQNIKKMTKYSYSYIDMVLKGKRSNQDIIDCALVLLDKSELAKRSSRSIYYRLTGAKVENKSFDKKLDE